MPPVRRTTQDYSRGLPARSWRSPVEKEELTAAPQPARTRSQDSANHWLLLAPSATSDQCRRWCTLSFRGPAEPRCQTAQQVTRRACLRQTQLLGSRLRKRGLGGEPLGERKLHDSNCAWTSLRLSVREVWNAGRTDVNKDP